jgi:hypothetical protein
MRSSFDLTWTPVQLIHRRIVWGKCFRLRIFSDVRSNLFFPSQSFLFRDHVSDDRDSAFAQRERERQDPGVVPYFGERDCGNN